MTASSDRAAPTASSYWIETLGCPKNAVDSDKVAASLLADGLTPATGPGDADLVVVNTCAFVEAARQESVETVLALGVAKGSQAVAIEDGTHADAVRINQLLEENIRLCPEQYFWVHKRFKARGPGYPEVY